MLKKCECNSVYKYFVSTVILIVKQYTMALYRYGQGQ